MNKFIFVLLLLPSIAFADTVKVTWDAVTLDASGGPVQGLLGYKLYVSTQSGVYAAPKVTVGPNVLEASFDEKVSGKYFAILKAFNAAGESKASPEGTFEIAVKPPAPPKTMKFLITVTPVE